MQFLSDFDKKMFFFINKKSFKKKKLFYFSHLNFYSIICQFYLPKTPPPHTPHLNHPNPSENVFALGGNGGNDRKGIQLVWNFFFWVWGGGGGNKVDKYGNRRKIQNIFGKSSKNAREWLKIDFTYITFYVQKYMNLKTISEVW